MSKSVRVICCLPLSILETHSYGVPVITMNSGGMAELVGGKLLRVQTRLSQGLFHQPMDGGDADALAVAGTKEGAIVCKHFFVAFGQVNIKCFATGTSKIYDSFLVSFAKDDALAFCKVYIVPIELYQFSNSYPCR